MAGLPSSAVGTLALSYVSASAVRYAPPADVDVHEVLKRGGGVIGQTHVDRGGLDHRAPGSGQPVESLTRGQGRHRTGVRSSGADSLEIPQVPLDQIQVEVRREGTHAVAIDLDPRLQEPGRAREQDDADVDELTARHARHEADDGVAIRRGGWCEAHR